MLAQYASYHRDRRNIATHCLGVPMIVCAFGALLAHPVFATFQGWAVTPSLLGATAVTLWYVRRAGLLGVLTSAVFCALFALGVWLAGPDVSGWLRWGLGQFALGWLIQFIGHYFEGRKPAFFDDLRGLLVGPMFVVAELLFALGFLRRQRAEIERLAGA